jgi:geranylgeranyl reductase family protein
VEAAVNRFDAVVVGAGPSGAVAALCLARSGARVVLVDRVRFPRDKACGDLLSPRAIETLRELEIWPTGGVGVGGMELRGPTGHSLALPWPKGGAYPDRAEALPRLELDEQLRVAACEAGAEFVHGNLDRLDLGNDAAVVTLAGGSRFKASFVVGGDGSLSRVADLAGLSVAAEGLFGFALRYYVAATVARPMIIYWEPTPGRAFPGYGWIFPCTRGRVNLGLGMSVGVGRGAADFVAKAFPAFVDRLRRAELIGDVALSSADRKGGWLKMGLAGTVPARGRVLLVGDAAGAINPLAGEGISGAVLGARDAAEAILSSPGTAAARYREALVARHGSFYPTTAALQAYMAAHPRMFSLTGRILTAPGLRSVLGGPWSMYWNDLVQGAPPGPTQTAANTIGALAHAMTATSRLRKTTERRLTEKDRSLAAASTPLAL